MKKFEFTQGDDWKLFSPTIPEGARGLGVLKIEGDVSAVVELQRGIIVRMNAGVVRSLSSDIQFRIKSKIQLSRITGRETLKERIAMGYKTEAERIWREGTAERLICELLDKDRTDDEEDLQDVADMILDGASWATLKTTPQLMRHPTHFNWLKRQFDASPEFKQGIERRFTKKVRHEKPLTNVQFMKKIMEYSEFGALSQCFVIEALSRYSETVSKCDPKTLTTSYLSGEAWVGVAQEIKGKLDRHLRRIPEGEYEGKDEEVQS